MEHMFIKSFLLKAVIHKLLVGIGTEYLSMYSKDATEMSEKANTQKTKQNKTFFLHEKIYFVF